MEVAAALTDKAHSVSIIGIEAVPFRKALGEKVGKAIMKVGTRPWENGPDTSRTPSSAFIHIETYTINVSHVPWAQCTRHQKGICLVQYILIGAHALI
jgi:hypothetical protein